MKMKILFFVEAMGGGVFTYIVDLANALAKENEMYVAYAIRPQTPRDFKDYFVSNVHLIQVDSFCREINLHRDFKAFKEVKEIAGEIKPDIIHLHSSKAGVIGRLAFDGKQVPLFYTPHGYSFLMKNQSIIKRMLYKSIEFMCAKVRCTTIGCSMGEYEETLKLTSRAEYVDNGINEEELEALLNKIGNLSSKDPTVCTVGRICYQKNPDLFNEIAMELPHVKFLWIGDGELRNKLTASNIEVTGWLDRESALKISMKSKVFILTSLWEGLPISLLEAMYMKQVCIVSDVIGNRDVIHSGDNGYICKSKKDFVEAIENAMCEDTSDLSWKAYTDVKERYNTKAMANAYQKIYIKASFR